MPPEKASDFRFRGWYVARGGAGADPAADLWNAVVRPAVVRISGAVGVVTPYRADGADKLLLEIESDSAADIGAVANVIRSLPGVRQFRCDTAPCAPPEAAKRS
jgi:hypothetical protein